VWGTAFYAKAILDLVCDLFAGVASTVQIVYEDGWPPEVTPLSPPEATVGSEYSLSLKGTNGMRPYSWEITPEGALPPGLALTDGNTGTVSGVPTKPGTYGFYVTLSDSYGPSFEYKTDQLQIVVKPGPAGSV
jgi:hypothetical protein